MLLKDPHVNLYKAIKKYHEDNGYAPTVRELQEICNYKSTSTVYCHLKVLEKAEYIEMGERKSRAIRLL
ncbi:MAG: LexA repressor [Maledivibacter sp.]|jgi:repressor LexA|nr:LexA repressor [Maledivibacter sp.]